MVKNLGDTIWVEFVIQTSPVSVDDLTLVAMLLDPYGTILDADSNPKKSGDAKHEAVLHIPENGKDGLWTVKIHASREDVKETESIKFMVKP